MGLRYAKSRLGNSFGQIYPVSSANNWQGKKRREWEGTYILSET